MITPNSNQNILNFSVTRFINEISPIYQINALLANISTLSSKLISSELIISDRIDMSILSNFGRHMVRELGYTAYDSNLIGYSQPKLMGYLTETHSNNINIDSFAFISSYINSYSGLNKISVYDANAILSLMQPHNFLILDYNKLSTVEISKILTTIKLEDVLPSNVSMSNQLFAYSSISHIVEYVFNSNLFSISTGNSTYSGRIYDSISRPFGISLPTISSDISNFISSDSLFYDNLTFKIISITGISHASAEYITTVRNAIYRTINNYIINSPTNSFISYIDLISEQIIVSSVEMYSTLIKNELIKTILDSLISNGLLNERNPNEKSTIQSIYDLYSNTFSDTILDIESVCSRLSVTPLELLNAHIHFYNGLFGALSSFISNDCADLYRPQSNIDSAVSNVDLVLEIENVIKASDFSTLNLNNKKIMDASIASSLTSAFEKYIMDRQSLAGYSDLLLPITEVILFNSKNINKTSKLDAAITNAIISEFNNACWLRLSSVLSSSYPNFSSTFGYNTKLTSLPDITSLLNQSYAYQTSQIKGSSVDSKVIAISIFNTAMNANLDAYSIQRPI